ncbi:hypothetical protein M8J75_001151 [Diaphorina citri]|nr:hypothetical protein M8J75_001151 [Diaphorina citri]
MGIAQFPSVRSYWETYTNYPLISEVMPRTQREHAVRKRRQANTKNDPDDLLFLMTVPQDELEQIQAMADFAMQTLDLIDEDNVKRKVVKVIKAQKQLTRDGSGIMYYLWLETQDTQCPEDTSPESWKSDPPNCMNVPGPRRTCKVNLLRSWLPNRSPVNAHVVKSECDPLKSW